MLGRECSLCGARVVPLAGVYLCPDCGEGHPPEFVSPSLGIPPQSQATAGSGGESRSGRSPVNARA